MKHFILFYDYVADVLEKRGPHRGAHLAHIRGFRDGEVVLGGALADPVDMAVIVFKAESAAPIEAFVQADPYFQNGLVKSWRVREWATVVGEGALTKVKPA